MEKEPAQVTLQCIADAVICTDISGKVIFLNVVAERLTGWSQEIAGRPLAEVFQTLDAASRKIDPIQLEPGRDPVVHVLVTTPQ